MASLPSVGAHRSLGLALYIGVVGITSAVEWCFSGPSQTWLLAADGSTSGWWDIVYFNFISILTIGYGDYSPHGTGARAVTIMEALIGTGILGITLAAVTAKFLSSPKNAIVFSRHAYYCTENARLSVIFVNTTQSRLLNAEISSYFKLGGDWTVRPSVRSPFVTRAVQTFFTDEVFEDHLVKFLNEKSYAFRFGISGELGSASFSTAIEYKPADILVIPNRDALTSYEGFWNPNFQSERFQEMFHYHPAGAQTISDSIGMLRETKQEI